MVLSNPKYGLYKNLTMQLVVTGKDLLCLIPSAGLVILFCVILLHQSAGMGGTAQGLALPRDHHPPQEPLNPSFQLL